MLASQLSIEVPKFSNATFLKDLWQRAGELLCVLSQDTVEWVDVEAVADPPPISTSTDNTETIIFNVEDWLSKG